VLYEKHLTKTCVNLLSLSFCILFHASSSIRQYSVHGKMICCCCGYCCCCCCYRHNHHCHQNWPILFLLRMYRTSASLDSWSHLCFWGNFVVLLSLSRQTLGVITQQMAVRTRQSTVWSGNVLRILLEWVLRGFPCLSKRISAYDVATVHGLFLLRPYLPSIRGNLPILFDANHRCSMKNTWQKHASIYCHYLFAFYFMHLQVSDSIAFMVRWSVVVVVVINTIIIAIKIDPFCFYCGCTVPVRVSIRGLIYASGAILWFYSVSPDKH